MKLYKYVTYNTGKKIIESSELGLSPPSTFNDPFDSFPIEDEEELQRAINIMNGYFLDATIINLLTKIKKESKRISDRILVSIVLAEIQFARWLVKKKPHIYQPACDLNKAVKAFLRLKKHGITSQELKRQVEEITKKAAFLKEFEWISLSNIFTLRDRMYVGCFSSRFDSLLMWAYYANSHRGVCLEFDIDEHDPDLWRVDYQEIRPGKQVERFAATLCGNLFSGMDEMRLHKDAALQATIMFPYRIKAKEWEHEQEYRYIYLDNNHPTKSLKKVTCDDGIERVMLPVKITKVYLGVNMTEENKQEIRGIIPEGIEIVEATISKEKYEIIV